MTNKEKAEQISLKIKELEDAVKAVQVAKFNESKIFDELKTLIGINLQMSNKKVVLTQAHKKVSDHFYYEMLKEKMHDPKT